MHKHFVRLATIRTHHLTAQVAAAYNRKRGHHPLSTDHPTRAAAKCHPQPAHGPRSVVFSMVFQANRRCASSN
jgi:hypothetical protein